MDNKEEISQVNTVFTDYSKISSDTKFAFKPDHITILILLLIISLTLPLVRLGKPGLGSPHEARVVVTGKNMAESGDWIVPYFNGTVRLQKPPLPYWTIAILAKTFGSLDEFLFRLPSAIMGITGIIITLMIGRVLFSWHIGLLAALLQALTTKYIIESRLARVDMYLTFWVIVSILLLSIIFFGKKRRDWLWPILWAAIAIGFLAKWLVVFIFVTPLMLYGLWAYPQRRPHLMWHLLGILAFLLLALSWVTALVGKLGWENVQTGWIKEVSDNITSPVHRANHGFLYYIPQLFVLSFPWSALIPAALTVPFWVQARQERDKLLGLFLSVIFALLLLSLISKKKTDYLLPALPFMAILAAKAWEIYTSEIRIYGGGAMKYWRRALGSLQAGVFIIAAIVVLSYCFFDTELRRYGAIALSGLSLGAAGIFAFIHIQKTKGWSAIVSLFLGAAIFSYVLFGLFMPYEARISSADFAHSIAEIVDDAPLVYFQGRDDTLIYHLDRTIPTVNDLEQLRLQIDEHPETFVLVQSEHLDTARQVADYVVLHHPRFRDVSLPLPGKDKEAVDIYLLHLSGSGVQPKEFNVSSPRPPGWLNVKNIWLAFGFLAQGMFFSRFLIQWIASEKKKQSVIPVGFWWLSLTGGIMLFGYAIHRRDPVFIVGQGTGVLIYLRNLYFIYAKRPQKQEPSTQESRPQPSVNHSAPAGESYDSRDDS
jgi:4-amino-4-deoxy-L-arabinose transferase-like glycosyltransferase